MDCVKSAKELKKIAKEEQRRFLENAYAKANEYAPEFEKVICERINAAAKDGRRSTDMYF